MNYVKSIILLITFHFFHLVKILLCLYALHTYLKISQLFIFHSIQINFFYTEILFNTVLDTSNLRKLIVFKTYIVYRSNYVFITFKT